MLVGMEMAKSGGNDYAELCAKVKRKTWSCSLSACLCLGYVTIHWLRKRFSELLQKVCVRGM